ncbi:hypothetical protein [Streptomyces canus]|uniref:hypothetical protein n=1 Tax=Streptomyces canus TaxID=58343 RepID=UPI00380934FE
MTTAKDKSKPEGEAVEAAAEPATVEEKPPCGKPHHLPALAQHITCTEPAPDPDLAPGTPEHEHRHQDGDALYVWR